MIDCGISNRKENTYEKQYIRLLNRILTEIKRYAHVYIEELRNVMKEAECRFHCHSLCFALFHLNYIIFSYVVVQDTNFQC